MASERPAARPVNRIVAVGASAGGVETLRDLVARLPADLDASVLVVLHLSPNSPSALDAILRRAGDMQVVSPETGDPLVAGTVYVAPPDRHLLVRDGGLVVSRGPRENGHRPAVDPLFRSVSRWYGPAAIGVVLSGTLDDGAAGAAIVGQRGGRVLVQDPDEALYPGMPRAALRAWPGAEVTTLPKMADVLVDWIADPIPWAPVGADRDLELETDMAEFDDEAMADPDRPGIPAGFSCPDCNGAMFEIDSDVMRFRCRVGHAWSPESLVAQQVDGAEAALWMAIRHLEEKAALHRRLADSAAQRGSQIGARMHVERAKESGESAEIIRRLLRVPLTGDAAASSSVVSD